MRNLILESHSLDPYYNLALEHCLFESIAPGDAALYLWQNQNTVVIGRNQNAWRECRCELLEREGGCLARRRSGGGAVFHDVGNLNYTFAASSDRYDLERQLGVIIDALNSVGIRADFTGRNDIAVDGRKVSGNAFEHSRGRSLQHGTLLISVDMERLSRYLNPSPLKLRAKGVESVRARVMNLAEAASGLTPDALRPLLCAAFERAYGSAERIDANAFDAMALEAGRAQMASWEWRFGQTPRFDARFETRFDWGEVELLLELHEGRVAGCALHTDAMDARLAECVSAALDGVEFGSRLPEALAALNDMGVAPDQVSQLQTWLAGELA